MLSLEPYSSITWFRCDMHTYLSCCMFFRIDVHESYYHCSHIVPPQYVVLTSLVLIDTLFPVCHWDLYLTNMMVSITHCIPLYLRLSVFQTLSFHFSTCTWPTLVHTFGTFSSKLDQF